MPDIRPVRSALISVYHKEGLDRLALALHERGIEIWSTGGTRDFLEGLGVKTKKVEDLTGYPSILGGRVKTLHPKVFGGILHRSEHMDDLNEMAAHEIPPLDLVIVDLYPFEQTLLNGGTNAELIEKIDIGGISLLRAAAKNHLQCTVVSSARQYPRILNQILEQGGTSLAEREAYAAEAFAVTSHYDRAIFDYLNRDGLVPALRISNDDAHVLRYGENPHQKASFYGPLDQHFEVLSGKALRTTTSWMWMRPFPCSLNSMTPPLWSSNTTTPAVWLAETT